jgi:hypothetical protein
VSLNKPYLKLKVFTLSLFLVCLCSSRPSDGEARVQGVLSSIQIIYIFVINFELGNNVWYKLAKPDKRLYYIMAYFIFIEF